MKSIAAAIWMVGFMWGTTFSAFLNQYLLGGQEPEITWAMGITYLIFWVGPAMWLRSEPKPSEEK